jgi:flagellar hook assembly protein FlgD
MKFLISTVLIIFTCSFIASSQTDTLVIKLKNNTIEKIAVSKIQKIKFENVTAVTEPNTDLSGLSVSENYPNPFQDQTNIEFDIASTGDVEVLIYNNNGTQIKKLECNNCRIGKNSLIWNATDNNNYKVESGVYYFEVRFNSEVISKKMIMLK